MRKKLVDFYNTLAEDYDDMTSFQKRFKNEGDAFHKFIQDYQLKTALDAGCGTGFHSILLTQLGLKVVSTELSKEMIQKAKTNAKNANVQLNFLQASFQNIHKKVNETFDSVFCLGNSISHLLSKKDLITSFRNFKRLLNPNGILVLQLLNYDKILREKTRIQNIKLTNKKIFIRFYDYKGEMIIFNILMIEKNKLPESYKLNSVNLKAWRKMEIITALKEAGFRKNKIYGDIFRNKYDKNKSKDQVIVTQM